MTVLPDVSSQPPSRYRERSRYLSVWFIDESHIRYDKNRPTERRRVNEKNATLTGNTFDRSSLTI